MKDLREIPQSIFSIDVKPEWNIEEIEQEFYQSWEPKIMPSFMLTLYKTIGDTYYMEHVQGWETTWYKCNDNSALFS